MTTEENTATIGDNLPPSDMLITQLAEQHDGLMTRADEIAVGLKKLPDEIDETTEAKATDFVKQCKLVRKEINAAKSAAVAPIDAQSSRIKIFFKAATDPLTAFILDAEQRLHNWDIKKKHAADEKARLEQEEREAEAEEARQRQAALDEKARKLAAGAAAERDEARQAERDLRKARIETGEKEKEAEKATKAAEKATDFRVRGDQAVAARVNKVQYEVVNMGKVPRKYKMMVLNDEAIRAATQGDKGLREIPGLNIWVDESVSVR